MNATASTLLRRVPRSGLYIIITVMASGLVYFANGQVKAVEAAAVEARADSAEAKKRAEEAERAAKSAATQVAQAMQSIRDTREIVEEMRRDQLEFYRWQAQQSGDWRRENRYANRLRELPPQPNR